MKRFLHWFRSISIAKKLYFTIGAMAFLITLELCSLMFSLNTLSSVRALVGAEGLWSKAQKNAIISLKNYALSRDEKDYKEYLHFLKIPIGDHIARMELMKQEPDYTIIQKGFIQGGNHPHDIEGMTNLLRRFSSVSYINKAITIWSKGDILIMDLHKTSVKLHEVISTSDTYVSDRSETNRLMSEIDKKNKQLTYLENKFSTTLGEGSRWLEDLVSTLLLIIALTVEASGLLLTFVITRNIKKDISAIINASIKVAEGDFTIKAKVYSEDEIGILAKSFNLMISDLDENSKKLHLTQEILNESREELAKINEYLEGNKNRIDEILEVLMKITIMDFSQEIELSENQDVIDAIAMGINMVSEELQNHILELNDNTAKVQAIFENAPDAMIILDEEGKIQLVNSQTTTVFGYTDEELVGQELNVIVSDSFLLGNGSLDSFFKLIKQRNLNSEHLDLMGKRKDQEFFPLEMNLNYFETRKGKFLTVAIRDVSERKANEQARIKAENEIKIANETLKFKQQFLSNMSHEIRTPMTAIIGFTKIIAQSQLTAKQREYLSAIQTSGDALLLLINDILDLAKVDAGKMVFIQAPFDLKDTLHSIFLLLQLKADEKNIELVQHYDDDIPKILLGDAVRLHQILVNLLSNAIKFTNEGSITVDAKILNETNEKIAIQFSVSDTGIGINENQLGVIFQSFEQATNQTSKLYGGTGLGLAIVKQLVEAQGGTITVQSEVNVGSTFSFFLEFEKTAMDVEPEVEFTLDPAIKHLNILVAEDNPLNKLLIKYIITDFGFDCDIAENGEVAIEMLKQNTYDIILMDLQMPVMSGIDATLFIRNKLKLNIPIIALTADIISDDLKNCFSVGMNDYTSKPINEKVLYSKIIRQVKKSWNIDSDQV